MPRTHSHILIFLLTTFGVALFAPVVVHADVPFVTSQTITGASNRSQTIQTGGMFYNATGINVTITQLGRWVLSGNNQTHTITVYNGSAVSQGSVTINCSGATPNQFLYGTLASPITIGPGYWFVLSSETAGGDTWTGGTTGQPATYTDIGNMQTAYMDTPSGTLVVTGIAGVSNGPVSFKYSTPFPTWTKSGTKYTTDGTQYQVYSAIYNASPDDTITMPSGTYTWGAVGTSLVLNKAVTLVGDPSGGTIINIAPDGPTGYGRALFVFQAPATVAKLTLNDNPTSNTEAFLANGVNGWRISKITYNPNGATSYFAELLKVQYGLIDGCNITGGAGNDELIFSRGPTNAWQTANSMGTANAIFVEDCTFNGPGYVGDFNSNSSAVVRFCTINGPMKIDGHGLASNTPPRSVREVEIYSNTWTNATGGSAAIELRGGTGMIFNNSYTGGASNAAWFFLSDYGYQSAWPNFGNNLQTPSNYPIGDQIGTGQDITISATAITIFKMVRIASVGTTNFTAIGAPNNTVGTQFIATGPGTGTGTVTTAPAAAEPVYVWNNLNNGAPWIRQIKTVAAGAITLYGSAFTERDMIQANRDFFADSGFDGTFAFDGSAGIGRGTKAQMLAVTPTKTGVGFWVTDEAGWNTTLPANTSGQLYTWSGAAWILKYTPYTYPHPRRRPSAPLGLLLSP